MEGSRSTHTDRIIEQGRAIVRAIEALVTIKPTGPIERDSSAAEVMITICDHFAVIICGAVFLGLVYRKTRFSAADEYSTRSFALRQQIWYATSC